MTREEVCTKIDKYLSNDCHQPIMVDVAATTELCQLESHYNVGHLFLKASKLSMMAVFDDGSTKE